MKTFLKYVLLICFAIGVGIIISAIQNFEHPYRSNGLSMAELIEALLGTFLISRLFWVFTRPWPNSINKAVVLNVACAAIVIPLKAILWAFPFYWWGLSRIRGEGDQFPIGPSDFGVLCYIVREPSRCYIAWEDMAYVVAIYAICQLLVLAFDIVRVKQTGGNNSVENTRKA